MKIVKSSATLRALTAVAIMFVSQSICTAQANELDELRATVESLRKTVAEQNARIAALEAHLESSPPAKSTVAGDSLSGGGTNEFSTESFATERSLIHHTIHSSANIIGEQLNRCASDSNIFMVARKPPIGLNKMAIVSTWSPATTSSVR